MAASSDNNVTIDTDKTSSVFGGYSKEGDTNNNTVNISGATVNIECIAWFLIN